MIALYIIGGIVLLIAGLMFLSIRIRIAYDGVFSLSVGALFINIKIFPSEKKVKVKNYRLKKLRKPKKEKKKKKKKAPEKARTEQKKSGFNISSPSDLIDLVKLFAEHAKVIIKKFGKYLKIRVDNFLLSVGGEDAAAAAVTYGAVSQSASYLFTLLESTGNLTYADKSECDILVNYLSKDWHADIGITFKIKIWQLLSLGISALKAFIKIKGKIGG